MQCQGGTIKHGMPVSAWVNLLTVYIAKASYVVDAQLMSVELTSKGMHKPLSKTIYRPTSTA